MFVENQELQLNNESESICSDTDDDESYVPDSEEDDSDKGNYEVNTYFK